MPNYGIPFANGVGDAPAGEDNGAGGNSSGFNWSGAMPGLGGIASGLMGMLGGGGQNPSAAAMPYLNQIQGINQKTLGPYNQMGQQAGGQLNTQYGNLLSNPGGMINNIGQSYHQSPGFQFAMRQALMGSNNAAAAGGMAGSPMNTQQNMGLATNLANQDYYNWMSHAQGMYGAGLQGMQNMYGVGAESANNMASNMSQAFSQQAQAAYAGQENQNQNQSSSWGNIIGGIGDIASLAAL